MHERTCIRSGGRQPPVAHGNARARAFASRSARLPTVHQRTPTQSRCYILDNIHGGLTRGALALGESRLLVRGDFFCTRVLGTTAGSRPPLLCRNANVCRRNCDFCDARTHVHQERGASAPRGGRTHMLQERGASRRNRTGKGVRLLRWTNACASGAGGVSPPWFTVTQLQRRGAIVRGHPTHTLASASAVTVPPHPRRADARRSCVG
jgi:hypothetical protein